MIISVIISCRPIYLVIIQCVTKRTNRALIQTYLQRRRKMIFFLTFLWLILFYISQHMENNMYIKNCYFRYVLTVV